MISSEDRDLLMVLLDHLRDRCRMLVIMGLEIIVVIIVVVGISFGL